jgi:peptide deformylase
MPEVKRLVTENAAAYLDEHGEPQFVEAAGWYARILQHEIDPLRGALYKALSPARKLSSDSAAKESCFSQLGRRLT